MRRFESWDELLAAFRALGGVADNVAQGHGAFGRGLFPVDPKRPVRLHVPKGVLVLEDDAELKDGELRVRQGAKISEPARAFFDAYQRYCSWGGGGREEVMGFFNGVRSLPEAVASALTKELHLGFLFEEVTEEAVRERFVKSRCISIDDANHIMPMIELANHSSDGQSYDASRGVTVSGRFEGEILVRYDFADTCLRFIHYGFISPERFAFCVPLSISQGGVTLTVRQDYHLNRQQDDVLIPLASLSGAQLTLSHLTLGDRKRPYSPRRVFQHVARRVIDAPGAEELFDRVLMVNRDLFLRILAACEETEGPMVTSIRRMCRLQLEALSSCLLRQSRRVG